MSTLFLTGLFADRHRGLFTRLALSHNVISFEGSGFLPSPQVPFEFAEKLIPASEAPMEPYLWEMSRALDFTLTRLRDMMDNAAEQLDRIEFMKFHRTCDGIWNNTWVMERLIDVKPPKMVVVCADYDYTRRRNVVMVARRRDVPCLNVDHGSQFSYLPRRSYKKHLDLYLENASNYVNVDNELEKLAIQGYLDSETPGPDSEFIVKGTPMDQAYNPNLDKKEARARLGLDQDKTVLALMGTFPGGYVGYQVRSHLEYVEFICGFLKAWSQSKHRDALQVVYKLHPAFAREDKFNEVKTAWERELKKWGLPNAPILPGLLPDLLAASDMMISPSFSSVLFDGFLAGMPSLVNVPAWMQDRLINPKDINKANVIWERGALTPSLNMDELWEQIHHFLDPSARNRQKEINQNLMKEYKVEQRSTAEKIENLSRWIDEMTES